MPKSQRCIADANDQAQCSILTRLAGAHYAESDLCVNRSCLESKRLCHQFRGRMEVGERVTAVFYSIDILVERQSCCTVGFRVIGEGQQDLLNRPYLEEAMPNDGSVMLIYVAVVFQLSPMLGPISHYDFADS